MRGVMKESYYQCDNLTPHWVRVTCTYGYENLTNTYCFHEHFRGLRLHFSAVGISGNEGDADKNLNELFSRLYANMMFSVFVEVVKAAMSCCVLQHL